MESESRAELRRTSRRDSPGDWRTVRTARGSGALLLGIYTGLFGAAILAATVITLVVPRFQLGTPAFVLWVPLVVAVALAIVRGLPTGMLRFAAGDVLMGVFLGLFLRMLQGQLSDANARPFPSLSQLPAGPLPGPVLGPASTVMMGALIEEAFFRGVLLVAVYSCALPFGRRVAASAAVAVSTAAFVLAHVPTQGVDAQQALQISLLGLLCSVSLVATGRIWTAVILHLTYNASFLLMAIVGSASG